MNFKLQLGDKLTHPQELTLGWVSAGNNAAA
ncbi:Uncharacterised protein [Serratia fonticola]|nr:Uncharacterised protein [Serratia fonticola]CAI1104611.1 Uncharacterised protein [Serratia fonticola]CAI1869459.1 Uncharacterised protein [Serratia fonticola]CAI1977799.1 Uncharacterised protein [Serratia fonticola]